MIQTFRESVRLLATRRFGTFWFASLLSSIGTWAQQVAEPWLLLTLGAAMTISNTAANSILQSTAEPGLLGQTVGVYMLAMRGGISLGALLTGAAVDMFGVRHALLLNGAMALVVQAAVAWTWLRAPLPGGAATA